MSNSPIINGAETFLQVATPINLRNAKAAKVIGTSHLMMHGTVPCYAIYIQAESYAMPVFLAEWFFLRCKVKVGDYMVIHKAYRLETGSIDFLSAEEYNSLITNDNEPTISQTSPEDHESGGGG